MTPERGHPHRNSRRNSRRTTWRIAAAAVLGTLTLAAGIVIGTHVAERRAAPPEKVTVVTPTQTPTPAPTPPSPSDAALVADFAQFEAGLHATAGIAINAVGEVGGGQPPITLGTWQTGPAWSTIKVPLAIAALNTENPPTVTDAMRAAITESDNAAAESIWEGLGDPVTAAHDVEAVLGPTGDPTTVQSQKVRPEYTAFGQTDWSLTNQLRFVSAAVCDKASAPIFALMAQVEPEQRWGIGTIPDTSFKGGWGPSPTGAYLVRQMGVLTTPTGQIAVTLAAQPDSGSFDDGTADLTAMAKWLTGHLADVPTGQCNP